MINDQVERIQKALFMKGFLVGEVDGVFGRRTIAALKAFQEDAGLQADGVFGPKTSRKLFPLNRDAPTEALLPWVVEARSLLGTKEVEGPNSNIDIINMAKGLDTAYPNDDIPWCGLFVAHCIGATLPGEVLPANPLRARGWERFGDATEPRTGAVMVFWRVSRESGLGHVGFYVGEDKDNYVILGGNQGNAVCEAPYPRSRFLTARWPRTAASPGLGQPIMPIEITRDGMMRRLNQEAPHQRP